MRSCRGFTLIELMIVVAVAGILAGVAGSYVVAGRRNATVASAALTLQTRIEQLQYLALSEQTPHLLVVADVVANDPRNCGSIFMAGCARVFHLRGPNAAWKLEDFDVTHPGDNVQSIADHDHLGSRVRFHLAGKGATLPKPFDAYGARLQVFDDDLTADCKGSRKCVGFRFLPDGQVALEFPDPDSASSAAKAGHAFALSSELTGEYAGAQQAAVLVAAPSGITRSFVVP